MSNLLASPAMVSTQIQALFLEAFEKSPSFMQSVRQDIQAVKDRDPAVKSYTDVILYFKGFKHYKHIVWHIGSGILIDHGTGVVIGETAVVGNNVSMLHKVTLGGTGLRLVQRHPMIGDGVLLGAGATLLGPITIGEGANIGAASMVLTDIPPHCVAVGVPAKVISRRHPKNVDDSPAQTMETN
eukprot:gene31364-38741_t